MNNSRNKKLLASFLTALGLTTNSANVNVSASFKQFGSDLRFALKVLGGEKAQERNKLDELANEINNFSNSSEKKASDYLNLCSKLKSNLDALKQKRNDKKYNSRLATSINEVINNYPENCNHYGDGTANMENWVKSVSKTVNGRYSTVWGEDIKNAVTKLSQIDTDYLYYETENNIQKFINLISSFFLNKKRSIQGIEIAKENSEKIIRNAIDAIINRKFKQVVGMFDLKNRKIYDYGYGVVGDDYKEVCDYEDFANKLFDIMFRNGHAHIEIKYNKEDFKNFEVVEKEAKDNEKIHDNILKLFTDVFNDKKQMGRKWCNLVCRDCYDQLALSFEVDGKKYSMYILPECGYSDPDSTYFGTFNSNYLYEKKYNFDRIKQVALVSETDGVGVIIEVNPKENKENDDDDNDVSFVSNKNNEINNTGKNIQNLNKAALNSDKRRLSKYFKEHPEEWQLFVKNLIDDAKEMISSQINKKSKFDVVGVFDFNNKKIYDYYYDIEKDEDNDYYDIYWSFKGLGQAFLAAQEHRKKAVYNWGEFSVIQGGDGKTNDNQTFTKNILSFFNNVFNDKEEIKNCVYYQLCSGSGGNYLRLFFDFVVNNKKYSFIVCDRTHQLVLFSESDGKALIIEGKKD